MKQIVLGIFLLAAMMGFAACSDVKNDSETVENPPTTTSNPIATPTALPTSSPEPSETPGSIGYTKGETRLVREAVMYLPGAEFDTIRYLEEGERFEVLEAGCEWHKVLAGQDVGYVLARDVADVNPADSPYYIYIEKGSHTITVYEKDSNGKYTRVVHTYITATGETAGKTPTGVFTIYRKREWREFDSAGGERDHSYAPYTTWFLSDIYIHGPIYEKKDFYTMFGNTYREIGTDATAGCLRTTAGAAYWIYMNCPLGTNVEIVNGSPRGIEPPALAAPGSKNGRYYDVTTPFE